MGLLSYFYVSGVMISVSSGMAWGDFWGGYRDTLPGVVQAYKLDKIQ